MIDLETAQLVLLLSAILALPAYSQPDTTTQPPAPLTLYERAVMGTPVPARLLRAVAIVESGERDDAIGRDGYDKGRMQLRELYHAERVALYGQEYDPHNPVHATRIAALILAGHFERFRDWRLALSAYNKGADRVLQTGLAVRYLELIEKALEGKLSGAEQVELGKETEIWRSMALRTESAIHDLIHELERLEQESAAP